MLKDFSPRIGSLAAAASVSLAMICCSGCKPDPNAQKQKYLESGKRYEKEGKLKEAAIQFSNAVKVDKNYSDAHYELAKTYIQMGSIMAGYQELMRTVDLSPSNVHARLDLGTMLVAGGVLDRASEQAKAVLAIDANNADAYALSSNIAEKKGDHVEAMTDIQHALSIDPNRASFHTMLALLDSTKPNGGTGEAEQELRKAVSLDTKDSMAHLELAALLEKKGDRAGAEAEDQAAVRDSPKDLKARGALATLYVRAGDNTKAEQTLRQAVEDLPDNEDSAALLRDFYQRTGQDSRADGVFSELAAKYPKSVPIRLTYARVLIGKQDYAKAKSISDDLNKTNGNNPQVEMLNAILLIQAGKKDEGFNVLQKAAKNSPENAQLHLMLANVAASRGDQNVSETNLKEAQSLDPSSLDAAKGLAGIASSRGDWTKLAQVADNAILLHPNFAEAYIWRGTAEANGKQFEQAEADFQTAAKKDPNNAEALIELGQLRLAKGQIAEGRTLVEQGLAKNPNSIKALKLLVQLDLLAKQPDKAIALVQDQISKAPNNATLYNMLAAVQLNTKDFAGARDNSKKAMQLDPSSQDSVQIYSQAEMATGEIDPAIAVWQQWMTTHPNDPQGSLSLGMLEENKGDQAKAMDYYKKTLQINPGQPMASNNLAYLMVENGQNVDVALSHAQAARRSMPDSPNTADTLAWVFYYKGTYSSARDLLEEALKTAPNNASIHYHLGMTYRKLGDKTNADLHLKKAATLAPNSREGKDAQAALAQAA